MALAAEAWEVTGNPYLGGLFGPVTEERTDDDLEVIGEIPADLDGVFVRNGPNPQFRRPGATTGSTGTAWCTPFASRTAMRRTATAGSAPMPSTSRPTPSSRSSTA